MNYNYNTEERKEKLLKLAFVEGRLRLLYMWIKQEVITLKEFIYLHKETIEEIN